MALVGKPITDAIQTNDSFAKIINQDSKKKSPKKDSPAKTNAFFRKQTTSVPYPIKSNVIGETLQASSFNQSNTFISNGLPDHTNNGNMSSYQATQSPRGLEGTRMKLTVKSNRNSPFEKEPDSPTRKRLSPKTLAGIKGGTRENPIKINNEASKLGKNLNK